MAGYQWSSSLWHSSFDLHLPANLQDDGVACETYKRPVKVMKLGREAAPLVKPYVGYDEVKDLSWLYASNFNGWPERYRYPRKIGMNEATEARRLITLRWLGGARSRHLSQGRA